MRAVFLFSIVAFSALLNAVAQAQQDVTAGMARYAGKTTSGIPVRCIAIVGSQYNGAAFYPVDSATYAYSGTRGGSVLTQMNYDTGQTNSLLGGPVPQHRFIQSFDINNKLLVHTDQQYNTAAGTFNNLNQSTYAYDAYGNVASQVDLSWNTASLAWDTTLRTDNTYTIANKLSTQASYSWSVGGWLNNSYISYSYSAVDSVTARYVNVWNGATSLFDSVYRDTMLYDASNNLASMADMHYNAGLGVWQNNYKNIYTNYLSAGCNQTLTSQLWNASSGVFENATKDTILYNAVGQPTFSFEKVWNYAGYWVYDNTSTGKHYYYESATSAAVNVLESVVLLNIFPLPAKDVINIDIRTSAAATTTFRLIDMQGRLVRTQEIEPCNAAYQRIEIPVCDLASGIYSIHLECGGISNSREITIAR